MPAYKECNLLKTGTTVTLTHRTFDDLFQSQNNSWIENHNPIFDYDFLIDAEQVSIFQLSKHSQ